VPFASFFYARLTSALDRGPRRCPLTRYLYWNTEPPGIVTVAFHTGYDAGESAIWMRHQ
jgi:hypothetical protein